MFCNKCGQEITENGRFCQHCGATLAAEPAPVENAPYAQQYQNAPQPNQFPPVYPGAPVNQMPPAAPMKPVDPGASQGQTSFILGLVGLIAGAICSCGCAFLGGILPAVASILAIVFGNQAKQKSAAAGFENKQARTGMILGIVGISVIVVFIIINAILGAVLGASGFYDSFVYEYI